MVSPAASPRSSASSASSNLNRTFSSSAGSTFRSLSNMSLFSESSVDTIASLENQARDLIDFSSIPENFDTLSGEEKKNHLARHLVQNFTNISQRLRTARTAEETNTIKVCLIALRQLFDEIENLYTKLEETSAMQRIKLGVIQNVMGTLVVTLTGSELDDTNEIDELTKAGELIHKMCRAFFNPDDDWKKHLADALKVIGMPPEFYLRHDFLETMKSVDPELEGLYDMIVPYLDADDDLEEKLIEKLKQVYNNFTEIEVNNLKIWLKIRLAYKELGFIFENRDTYEFLGALSKTFEEINLLLPKLEHVSGTNNVLFNPLVHLYHTLSQEHLDEFIRVLREITNLPGS